jgi:hypothetical protein
MKPTEADGNVHVVPVGGPNPEHIESKDCWCGPELTEDYTSQGGTRLYTHKEIQ